jgi:hypothetical protein
MVHAFARNHHTRYFTKQDHVADACFRGSESSRALQKRFLWFDSLISSKGIPSNWIGGEVRQYLDRPVAVDKTCFRTQKSNWRYCGWLDCLGVCYAGHVTSRARHFRKDMRRMVSKESPVGLQLRANCVMRNVCRSFLVSGLVPENRVAHVWVYFRKWYM